jgi:hypothetical protein
MQSEPLANVRNGEVKITLQEKLQNQEKWAAKS